MCLRLSCTLKFSNSLALEEMIKQFIAVEVNFDQKEVPRKFLVNSKGSLRGQIDKK